MKVSGFTILRDVRALHYPFVESISSLLPLVDEMIVGIGDADDGTIDGVRSIGSPKLQIVRSVWTLERRPGGGELSRQTNLALSRCSGDWAVYLQADEILHEDDLERLRSSLQRHRGRRTEGLLFDYLHFYGSYDSVASDPRRWYPRAVRAVRTGMGIESAGDACGFVRRRFGRQRGLIKAASGARIFHYGWCGAAAAVRARKANLSRFYPERRDEDSASRARVGLRRFGGTHPSVMRRRIEAASAGVPALAEPAIDLVPRLSLHDVRRWTPLLLSNAVWRASDWWWSPRRRTRRADLVESEPRGDGSAMR